MLSKNLALAGVVLFLSLPLMSQAAERVPWTGSKVEGSPDPPKPYHVERVYPNLQFNQPVELMPLGETGKMMLLEVDGKLYTFDDDPDCAQADLAIDLNPLFDKFRRAFGFGVHPNFAENRQIFIAYAGDPVARPDGTRLSRFVLSDEPSPRVDPASEEILLTWPSGGHNGCTIRFDSQGYLYFSAGDGARPFPPDEYDVSQDLSDLRSSICRIDVDHRDGDLPYAIPQDNPFLDEPRARPEIWAYGFRNPWRFTIAPDTDQLYCGDVGWELWEMIFDVRRGGNYGWSIFEGPQPIRGDIKRGPTPIRKPLVSYPHTVGQSVTGGIVYRGQEHADLQGAYLYGDYVTGLLWGLRQSEDQVTWNPVLAETGLKIITFAESRDRELLVVDYGGGIYKLIKNSEAGKASHFPTRLSETGLFESVRPLNPAPGVLSYTLASESWQGGTTSEYVVGIPHGGTVSITNRQRSWNYPTGTVFARTISAPDAASVDAASVDATSIDAGRKLETQVLHFDGSDWKPYSYVWRPDQSDAVLVGAEGTSFLFDDHRLGTKTEWRVPTRAQCRACHSRQNGGAVGFTLANLDHASSLQPDVNQLDRLIELAILDRRAPKPWGIRPMVDPHDPSFDLPLRARSYLAANCAHCHVRGGGGTVPLDLSFVNADDAINAIDVAALQGTFGIEAGKVIAAGDPYQSVLFYRMATSGTGRMPKLGSHQSDLAGLKIVHDWIASLDPSAESVAIGDAGLDDARLRHDVSQTPQSLRLLARLLDDDQQGQRLKVAEVAAADGNVLTRGLFERFLPAERRRQRLGDHVDAAAILALGGDTKRGREVFYNVQLGQCVNCHRLQGGGRSVGPDLDAIASKRSKAQLLDSILQPSKEIDPKFSSHAVLTEDGLVVTGLKVEENKDVLILRQADGKDVRISKADLASLKIQPQSLMPTGLAGEMTAQELADLLAFLGSLR